MSTNAKNAVNIALGALLVVFILWLLWKRKHAVLPASPESPGAPLIEYLGSMLPGLGVPPSMQLIFGKQGATMLNVDYNIPTPQFGYGGNASVYMPLFGFVGYTEYATYP